MACSTLPSRLSARSGQAQGHRDDADQRRHRHHQQPLHLGIQKLGKPFGLHIDELSKIGGKADGGRIPGRAGGGTIPGPWRGPRADNVLGISDKGVPTARVNPGEYITKVASTQRMERKHPAALAYINRHGTAAGAR
ncbi:hypothetical protein [Dermacoccus nishinomiyaensis]|uniref:hypothetical protein n=1 Tax=Dermacoccus nishinomiyaensis TaxID=1274 RepID=UPI0011C02D47|nr:hypothetical protein [Dermacoccus nishinomiyaensis]